MNIEKLRQEILQTIEGLRELGANIDLDAFEAQATSTGGEDGEAMKILLGVVNQMRTSHDQRKKVADRKAQKPKEVEPAPPEMDEEEEEDQPAPKKPVQRPKAKPKAKPAPEPEQEEDEPTEQEESEENDEEEEGDEQPDNGRLIDDEDDTDYDAREAAMPLTVNTKLAPSVKLATTDDVEEYYALLLRLRIKLDALEKIAEDDNDPLLTKLLKKTYDAYEDAMDSLEDIAEESFPAKLERFGRSAQSTLIEQLTEIGEGEKKKYKFDTKNASFSRFVRIEDASVVYSYVLKLKKVEDANGYVFPTYIMIVSQKMHLTEEDQERGVPPKPRFYVTRILKDAHDYHLGHEVKTTAELQVRIKKMLAFDSLRTDIEKINIPFTQKELSKKFVSEHVRKVTVDDDNHKIVVLLKKGTTQEDIDLLIPDFMKNLGAIVNLRKLAIKYHINVTVPSVEFVIIHKTKDKGIINRSQLDDMRDRYDLSDEAFRNLVKALTIGN